MPSSSTATATTFLAGATCALLVRWLFAPKQNKDAKSPKQSSKSVPEALRKEQLSRHELYFGTKGMESIQGARVCVVGLGGVGSHTAIMLARGGVGFLRLIDFDQVTLSSLNRHACATLRDVGIPKVEAVKNTCLELGVENVEAVAEMYTAESGPGLLSLPKGQSWDIVIDCIDDVPTKAALLAKCITTNTRVLSCMGAGGKSDMTRLHVSDLRTASRDPLASKLRQTIKKTMKSFSEKPADDSYLDDTDQLTIIYSSEKTVAKLADLTEEQKEEADKTQFGAVDGMRIRVLPVLGPLPAIMGQSLASIALCELGQKPIENPLAGERIGRNVRHKVFQQFSTREQKIAKGAISIHGGASYTGPLAIDWDDVEYLYGIWRNRCAITGAKIGAVLGLARWDTSKPATPDNLVLISRPAMKSLDEKGKESLDSSVIARIEQRLQACRETNLDWIKFMHCVSIKHVSSGRYLAIDNDDSSKLFLSKDFTGHRCLFELHKRGEFFGLKEEHIRAWVEINTRGSILCNAKTFGREQKWAIDGNDWSNTFLLVACANNDRGGYLSLDVNGKSFIGGYGRTAKTGAPTW